MTNVIQIAQHLEKVIPNCATPPSITAWQMLSKVQHVVSDMRVNTCHRYISPQSYEVEVVRHVVDGVQEQPRYKGLMQCNSTWLCPICSQRISHNYEELLVEGFANADASGYTLEMLTLTIQHSRQDLLDGLFKALLQARRLMRNRKTWKRIMNAAGFVGQVKATEITHGENGWHVHTHEVLILARPLTAEESNDIFDAWRQACLDAGLRAPSLKAYNCKQIDYVAASRYVTKFSVASELTAVGVKHTAGHHTIWDIIMLASRGNTLMTALVMEYARATFGRARLELSKGARIAMDIKAVLVDQAAERDASDDETVDVIDVISSLEWYRICHCEQREMLLIAYRKRGREGGRELIKYIMDGST